MPKITKRIFLYLATLLVALALTACAGALSSAEESLPPLPGEVLPAEIARQFTLPSGLNGQVSLDSYAGKRIVVLVFYRGFW